MQPTKEKITKEFTNYVNDKNLTLENMDDFLKSETFITFFNTITVNILGMPDYTHDKSSSTKGPLVYMAEATKERFVDSVDIIAVNTLYYGILGRLEYNYPSYIDLIKNLKEVRMDLKKELFKNTEIDTNLDTTQALMKVYMNLIYGMIDNVGSVLTSSHDAPREFIVNESKKVILTIVSFLINKSLPVFYIDTDEIHTKRLTETQIKELQKYYDKECAVLIDTSIASVDRDNLKCISSYYLNKKRYLTGDMSTRGMKYVDNDKVLSQNKDFFGRNFPDIFPEYAL